MPRSIRRISSVAAEAVDAEIAVEAARSRDVDELRPAGVKLADQLAHQREQIALG